MGFIEDISAIIKRIAPEYGICVVSPIIGQAILESASGTSELAVNAHNYFGLKYREGRCKTACGFYVKSGSEQNADGLYTSSSMTWMKFNSMEDGVRGYFDFTNVKNYENLKGVTSPREYLENIKADGYATSIKYVDNVMAAVSKYDLTKYDREESKMIFNVHAGHNADGHRACGAIGLIKESTEARKVKNSLIAMLRENGHTVYDCTVDDALLQATNLSGIVKKCNAHAVDYDISIHFNAGGGAGTEVLLYDNKRADLNAKANAVLTEICKLGFKNRGIKLRPDLYVLRNTKASAMLIECCFVDSSADVGRYSAEKMAEAICRGLIGAIKTSTPTATSDVPFLVKCKMDLNIRSTPTAATATNIVEENGCKKGTTYTIVEKSGVWGKLKSGRGWINTSSTYCERV